MSHGDKKDRFHLPIPTPARTGLITFDARDPDTKNNGFNGKVKGVTITLGDDAADSTHLVSAEDAIRVAMARQ